MKIKSDEHLSITIPTRKPPEMLLAVLHSRQKSWVWLKVEDALDGELVLDLIGLLDGIGKLISETDSRWQWLYYKHFI